MSTRHLATSVTLVALALVGCSSSPEAEPATTPAASTSARAEATAEYPWVREPQGTCPAPDAAASEAPETKVTIQRIEYVSPQQADVEVLVCPLQAGPLDDTIVNVAAFDPPREPNEEEVAKGFETGVTVPQGGTTLTIEVRTLGNYEFDRSTRPEIVAGTHSGFRPDGTWQETNTANWDTVR